MNKIYKFFGGKKFFFTEQSFVVLSTLTYFDKVSSEGFIMGMMGLIAVYSGANVYQKSVLKDGSSTEIGTKND